MLAVSFFFVLMGGILIFVGIVGLFLQFLTKENTGRKKWVILWAGGTLSLLLGLLMAMS
ncbi:hypothetical protein [Desulforamulus reducens]|uniref:hypothetical protein n=1 Tax=Desulforamulus reducens TaxID=59610 RepID=UPI0003079D99|nr:hypothetical protein [Desulforamulus reducens]